MNTKPPTTGRMLPAGILAWILPGAGHFVLGHRGLALVFFLAISVPYWTGMAFGGVRSAVDPRGNKWLFLAEMGIGGYTSGCLFINRSLGTIPPEKQVRYLSFYPEADVAQIYLATAGLLNVLAILDALSRAQTGGLPTFHRHLTAAGDEQRGESA
ncbi:MAG: hypothetical protein KKB50_16325 [Planctomycetes bacterium]|nr:hypothetical protein [Planctomycetota bacterium]